jgi:hypothetical protein
MRRHGAWVPSIIGCILVVSAVSAEPGPKSPDSATRAAELVRALGDRSFRVREQATKDLVEMGRPAFAALQAGTQDSDPEVRLRCRRILPAIFELEMKARLDQFVADTNPENDHGLPGWQRFRKLAGADQAGRELFARMVKADPQLMDAVENHPKSLAEERLAGRCVQLQQSIYARGRLPRSAVEAGEIAQVLFLASNAELDLSPMTNSPISACLNSPIFWRSVKEGDAAPAMKKLLMSWIERNGEDANTGYTLTNLLHNTQLKELVEPTLKFAANKKNDPHARANALTVIGRVGKIAGQSKDIVARLEPLLKDDSIVTPFVFNNVRGTAQIGDVALATMLRATGQHPRDYGYPAVKANAGLAESYYYLGFQNDGERTAARTKWQEFWSKEKDKEKSP